MLLMALMLIGIVAMTGCLSLEQATAISFITTPANVYVLNDEAAELNFAIGVEKGETTELIEVETTWGNIDEALKKLPNLMTVTGWNLSTTGDKTLTVTYGSLTLTYPYTVISGEIQGNGSKETPFLITSAEEFVQVITEKKTYNNGYTYYKLVSDIDFAGVDMAAYKAAVSEFVFNGSLDGSKPDGQGSYAISNFINTEAPIGDKGFGLFYTIANGTENKPITFKNITLNNCIVANEQASGAALLAYGMADTSAPYYVEIDNVDTDANSFVFGMKNVGGLIGYARMTGNLESSVFKIRNCDVAATVFSVDVGAGGLVGTIFTGPATTVVQDNNSMHGTIYAPGFANKFFGNNSTWKADNKEALAGAAVATITSEKKEPLSKTYAGKTISEAFDGLNISTDAPEADFYTVTMFTYDKSLTSTGGSRILVKSIKVETWAEAMAVLVPSTLTYNKADAKIANDPNATAMEMSAAALNMGSGDTSDQDARLFVVVTACEENARLSFNASTMLGSPVVRYQITLRYTSVTKAE